MTQADIKAVDAVLPQTQCEQCTYKGCLPYARAIVEKGESIDKCVPGAERVLEQLGQLLGQDIEHLRAGVKSRVKPPLLASIREEECIGCTKCIKACPVDAIIGASKKMHTVLTDACNGCELCLPPCPMDCIDLVEEPLRDESQEDALFVQSRERFEQKTARKIRKKKEEKEKHQLAKAKKQEKKKTIEARRLAIQEAMNRVKSKREDKDG
jgi:Na+-translocating ferredoxin:NAD+ oxidoreductase subunit B